MRQSRRTQADRSADTREALVAAARQLFATHGYADIGTEAIVRAAGVSRGALYHHFADKSDLFAAVFETVEAEIAARLGDGIAASGESDPIEMMRRGASIWLDVCADPEVHRIVLIDAPAVLGWARWTEIGNRYNMGLVRTLLTEAIDNGKIPPQPVDATAAHCSGPCGRRSCTSLVRMMPCRPAGRPVRSSIE